jgi:hypothetical protein
VNDETKQAIGEVVGKAVETAEEAVQRPVVKGLARVGFYTKGVLFVIIGSLAVLLVTGLQGGRLADATGALTTVAQEPYGKLLLIFFIIGAVGHGLWNILRGFADVDNVGKKWVGIIKRGVAVGIGLFYLGLAISATEIVLSRPSEAVNSQAEETFVAIVLAVPLLGALFTTLIGLILVGAGCSECYSGLTGKFQENYKVWKISGVHRIFINVLGVLSFTARAVLLVLMGYFFVRAALTSDMATGIGMDAALLTLLRSTYGRMVVLVTAVGLIAHGILAFYEAKYRRIS